MEHADLRLYDQQVIIMVLAPEASMADMTVGTNGKFVGEDVAIVKAWLKRARRRGMRYIGVSAKSSWPSCTAN